MMELNAVSVGHGRRAVLRDLSLRLEPGTLVGLLGPNGAGKSTLLAAMAGTKAPLAGRLTWRGRAVDAWCPRHLATQRAVVDQHDLLDFPFTAAEVVALGRYPHGGPPPPRRRIRGLLERVGAASLMDRRYPTLSGGEKQRVRLARAMCQLDGPGVLLLDEPTSAQDLGQRQRFAALVDALAHEEGHLVVAIVHDLDLAAGADRLLLLTDGACAADGPPADVLRPSLLKRAFGLEVSVHTVAGRLVVLPSSPHPLSLQESPC